MPVCFLPYELSTSVYSHDFYLYLPRSYNKKFSVLNLTHFGQPVSKPAVLIQIVFTTYSLCTHRSRIRSASSFVLAGPKY